MLPGMPRLVVLALLCACGNGSKSAGDQANVGGGATGAPEKIAVPGAPGEGADGASRGEVLTGAPAAQADDPRFHLKPEEGTLEVGGAAAVAGAEAIATIKLAPNSGYKVAVDYPTKLTLEAPDGVTLVKAELTAGGRNKAQGDATTWTEQAFSFDIKATPEKAGEHEIKGVFKFGVCDKDSCHPKKQPITIKVAAQ
jgi:hypothetical protein